MNTAGRWRLLGVDAFAGEDYTIEGEYDTEAKAVAAAEQRLAELEKTQPSAESGGQNGLQDRVYVVRPDGSCFRIRL